MDVLTCHYDLGQCYCGEHFNEPPAPPGWVNTWSCEVPAPGCPTWRPRAGTACDGNQLCPYQECAVEARCIEGVWVALYSINC